MPWHWKLLTAKCHILRLRRDSQEVTVKWADLLKLTLFSGIRRHSEWKVEFSMITRPPGGRGNQDRKPVSRSQDFCPSPLPLCQPQASESRGSAGFPAPVVYFLWTELGFPGGSEGKESAWNSGDPGLIPKLERSLGEGNGYLLQDSCLENSMARGVWWATVHGVAKNRTQLSHFHTFGNTHTLSLTHIYYTLQLYWCYCD